MKIIKEIKIANNELITKQRPLGYQQKSINSIVKCKFELSNVAHKSNETTKKKQKKTNVFSKE